MRTGRTHGGAGSRSFRWWWEGATLHICRQNGWRDQFLMAELAEILKSLEDQFGSGWFPLANNVEKMWNGTEKPGFGASCETRDRPSFSLPEAAGRGTVSGRDAAFAGWQ